jgi:hypothetical protein
MKFKVYHAKEPNFGMGDPIEFNDDNFDLVAEVECENVAEAFKFTNHIDDHWWNNSNVTLVKEGRSTSVGDVIVASDGQKSRCSGIGWDTF